MNKLLAFFDLFRKGSEVADPALWKNRGAAVIAVTALIYALLQVAKAYGYDFNLSPEDVGGIAVGVVAVVSLLVTYITSSKVGILPPKPGAGDGVQAGPAAETTGPGDMHGNP
jgi:hypothetical protein